MEDRSDRSSVGSFWSDVEDLRHGCGKGYKFLSTYLGRWYRPPFRRLCIGWYQWYRFLGVCSRMSKKWLRVDDSVDIVDEIRTIAQANQRFDKSCELEARRALEELDPSLTPAEREQEEAIG
ncbi:hypothetical protein V6N11_082045 [Hibiscus sabdariffa]|uniref:Uncharacterized protein n=2 Tax=Hibiscus sabdariffa TaxID=183260 RepID=A0ABR2QGX1_9ROSI